ncbi:MAG: DUF1684 domain-containing protein [Chloroflexi bacterium]|nr:DUF1684 domain-containing protein [Chloroflexota bacterium]MDA1240185.1 DUF1684 domain-containing protein [Chloroflexota bacterium]
MPDHEHDGEMTELEEFRAAKDVFFRDDPQSPLTAPQRREFRGLSYYPETQALSFIVIPEVFDEPEMLEMQTSDGEVREYQRFAAMHFLVGMAPQTLTLYRDLEIGHLFLPFRDATSGSETYGAGRYLDVPVLEDGRLLLDFNYAYHPYCAYNPTFSCPIPPPENRLPVPIRAGEREPAEG